MNKMSEKKMYAKVVLFNCNICKSVFSDENLMKRHVKSDHSLPHKVVAPLFPCKVKSCQFGAGNPNDLLRHILELHLPEVEVYRHCDCCEMMYIDTKSLSQHSFDKHGVYIDPEDEELETTIEITCKFCPDYKCENKNTFLNHLRKKHPQESFVCPFPQCGYSTKKFWKFPSHLQEHLTEETVYYKCPGCGTGFIKYESLAQHYRDKSNTGDSEHLFDLTDYPQDTFSETCCTLCDYKYKYEEEEDENNDYDDFESEFYDHIESAHELITPDGINYI